MSLDRRGLAELSARLAGALREEVLPHMGRHDGREHVSGAEGGSPVT
jgi:hypothetical protein